MKIVNISEKEYKEFLKKYDNSLFFQSVEWAKFKEKGGFKAYIIGLKDKNKLKACAILLEKTLPIIKRKMVYSPRGFIIDYNDYDLVKEFTKKLKEYLKEKNILFCKINPYVIYQERDKDGNIIGDKNKLVEYLKQLGYKHYGFYKKFSDKKDMEPRWLSVLDMRDKSVDELLKNMRSTTRWMINKSRKNYIQIKEAKCEDISDLKRVMKHTSERREFADRDLNYYEDMYKEFEGNDICKMLLAYIDLKGLKNSLSKDIEHLNSRIEKVQDNPKKHNQIEEFKSQIKSLEERIANIDFDVSKYGENPLVAVGIYLSYGKQVVYLYGGSYKEFMNYGAQYLMQYEMINKSKEKGFEFFNFYGIDGDFTKNGKHYGLFDFKRGFNADVVELIGEFDLVQDKIIYNLYRIMFGTYKRMKKIYIGLRGKIK